MNKAEILVIDDEAPNTEIARNNIRKQMITKFGLQKQVKKAFYLQ